MKTVSSIETLRREVKNWRQVGDTIAFVPTMGNLHQGHLALVQAARRKAERTIVSIFVNPTQFVEGEDFSSYPRTEDADRIKLTSSHADLLFLPAVEEIYPPDTRTIITVKGLSEQYCGHFRPGHFSAVATIVCKLFNIVQPDVALLGEKDYQQLVVIRRMVKDLNIPVKIHGAVTVRESDGLAMSSRNGYLSGEQRQIAPLLYQSLTEARDAVLVGQTDYTQIACKQRAYLKQTGFELDYFAICRAGDLQAATERDTELVILAAANLGRARLIDNIRFNINP